VSATTGELTDGSLGRQREPVVVIVMLDQAAAAVKGPGTDNVLFDQQRRSFWAGKRFPNFKCLAVARKELER